MTEFIGTQKPLTDGELDVVESRLGFSLPYDYREFLKSVNGGKPILDTVELNGEYFDYVGELFSVRNNMYSNDIFRNIEEYRGYLLEHYLPIGNSPGGDIYCISTKQEEFGAVYYWDHEEANYDGEPWEDNMIKLSSSFSEFVDNLYSEKT